jgi:cell division protein FtsZ
VVINVTGGTDLSLIEVSEASAIIQEAAHEDANIIFGAVVDPKMEGKVKITVIATGFDRGTSSVRQPSASAAQTPVDLQSYTAARVETVEKVALAASGGGGSSARISLSRRPVLEMPIGAAAGDPADHMISPGAEFEPASPLDVPAFLRRQHEA